MSEIDIFVYVMLFMLGACFGSFANVVIYRMPKDESIVRPGSHCQICNKPVRWFDNIPMFSWLILRGKCRNCKTSFSIRYFFVELLMAALFVLAFYFLGYSWTLLEALIFIFALVCCTFIDFDHMILPDEFTLSGIIIGLIGAAINPEREFLDAFFGVLMGGGFLWALAYFYFLFTGQDGMGGGDIKLLAWIGAVLGWKAVPFVIMVSAIIGSVVGLALARKQKTGLKTSIPFGPYLALGAVLYMFGGQTIALWYFNLFLPAFS